MKNLNFIIRQILGAILMAYILISCSSNMDEISESVIWYTDVDGESYPVIAVPGQVMICFNKIPKSEQLDIIEQCGGEVLEYYGTLRKYLVETEPANEMEFILNARRQPEVSSVRLNTISDPMSINMHLIDDFTIENDSHHEAGYSHGEYCYTSAKSAYPEHPERIVPSRHDTKGDFKNSLVSQYLEEIFSTTHSDSLILINMSFGYGIHKVSKSQDGDNKYYYLKNSDKYIRVPWKDTFKNEYGNLERSWWRRNYIDDIKDLASQFLTLAETNLNFIVFKSAGNDYCHEIDNFIFSQLPNYLTPEELEIVRTHFLFVSAKDDSAKVAGELYAAYANSPERYSPYLTMTDISHLNHDGTSFSSPYLLGQTARLFDLKGYQPLNSSMQKGYNVNKMVNHIKDATREYAQNIQQPGLFKSDDNITDYFYNNRYTFKGVLHSDTEDLCETGVPETYYYIEIEPIDIEPEYGADVDENLTNVTRLQIDGNYSDQLIGQEITVSGELVYNIAGCHIHTDAYLLDCNIETGSSIDNPNETQPQPSDTYYFNQRVIISGVLFSKTSSHRDEFTGEISNKTYYYLKLDQPIVVDNPNADNPKLPQFQPVYDVTEIALYGNFNPKEFMKLHVMTQGTLRPEITNKEERGIVMEVSQMVLKL